MSDQYRIRKAEGTWVVRAGGAVIGESTAALELDVHGNDAVIYFPREDIAMAFLDATDKITHAPGLGDARYFSIVTKSTTLPDVAWSYETPDDAAERIAGHLAFSSDAVTVEQV